MKKVRFYFLGILMVVSSLAMSQTVALNKYFIQFTDKNNSPYSILHPENFLTARAIARRTAQGIAIEENDLPVNPQYIQEVAAKGVTVLEASRWLNGVVIYTQDSALVDSVEKLPFVKRTINFKNASTQEKPFFKNESFSRGNLVPESKAISLTEAAYGYALDQIKQIDGIPLHNAGYLGQNMVIAVLDGGFLYVLRQKVFDSLRTQNRILGTKDFVHPGGNVYTESGHGRMVLSCMAAFDSGLMIGTAPDASYWLLRSEDVNYENVIEEYNWVCAAEFADSVGADIINSSLGYTTFDDPSVSHSYADLNGRTTISTLGAEIAASKGILVVNSAGNSGYNPDFPWIGAPADGDSVFSIGAVDAYGDRTYFSSVGPTSDGRIKPTVMALGEGTAVADADSSIYYGDGTSFSSPIIAGMCACLWQAHPKASNIEIMEALKETASNHFNPNNLIGWGIPDFALADSLLSFGFSPGNGQNNDSIGSISVAPNPFHSDLAIKLIHIKGNLKVEIYNLAGQMVLEEKFLAGASTVNLESDILSSLAAGLYIMRLTDSDQVYVKKIIKE